MSPIITFHNCGISSNLIPAQQVADTRHALILRNKLAAAIKRSAPSSKFVNEKWPSPISKTLLPKNDRPTQIDEYSKYDGDNHC